MTRTRKTALSIVVLILAGIVLYDLVRDQEEDVEEYYVERFLKSKPRNLNAEAVREIKQITASRDTCRFVVLGDSHGHLKPFKKVIRKALELKPDFIIHTGDMTSSGEYGQYMEFLDCVEALPVPIICIMGNHDDNDYGPECFSHIFGPHNFYFVLGESLFVFLDNNQSDAAYDFIELTGRAGTEGVDAFGKGLDNYQILWLEDLLAENRNTFIFMHTPPDIEPFRFHSFTRNSDRFVALAEKHARTVYGVFCGHIHGFAETFRRGVRYIISGGAGDLSDLMELRKGFVAQPNFVVVDVDGKTVRHSAVYGD